MDYRVGGTEVSSKGKVIIKKLIKGEKLILKTLASLKENGMN